MVELRGNIGTKKSMDNSEFVTVRGKTLEGIRTWVAGQEFVIVAIPGGRQDVVTPEISHPIVPGTKIKDKKSGQEFKILSKPVGPLHLVEIIDIHHMQLSRHLTEEEIRQQFHIITM